MLKITFCCLYLNLLGDTHGNVMGSVQDSRGNFRRLQTLQNNMERVLAEKFKELDTVNTQLKVLSLKWLYGLQDFYSFGICIKRK